MTADIFDDTRCSLGEGPLWHPERKQLFWFDINAHRLYTRTDAGKRMWQFDEFVSAAGWLDRDRLMVATETALVEFDLATGRSAHLCDLEADNPATRSNDGRADPYGGFWIGTMGKRAELGAGAIYRYYRGELRRLYPDWTIPNATCFTADGTTAYFADTTRATIWRVALDAKGWPKGAPEVFLERPDARFTPDGAVVDTSGNLWCAHYGHGRVSVHAPDGREIASHAVAARQPTCPAFGGPGLETLYVTTAHQGMSAPGETDGCTFALAPGAKGQAEHRVIL